MTEKELLYLDDALSHFEKVNDFYNDYSTDLQDENLKDLLDSISKDNRDLHQKFYKML